MSNTDRDSMLERWADGMEKLEQYYEGIYGPPATPPSLPPITTRDAMLEAIADGMERAKRNINKKSTTYHSDSAGYVKTVPAGDVHYASLEQIGGRTLVWNQLGDFGTITYIGSKQFAFTLGTPIVAGHKYYFHSTITSSNNADVRLYTRANDTNKIEGRVYRDTPSLIFTATNNAVSDGTNVGTNGNVWLYLNGFANDDTATNIMIADLTLLYGRGNEPSTVEEFQQRFPAVWYAYNPGSLLSAGVTEVVSKKADTTELATYSIPAEIQALEGYGWSAGQVYNYIDYERKVFVQNVGRADLGGRNWEYYTSPVSYFSINITDMKSGTQNVINSRYVHSNETNTISNVPDKETMVYQRQFRVRDSAYSGATTFKNSLSGVYLYYELDTPIETDISAYITDDNLIEVESGGTLTFPNQNGDDYRIPVPSSVTFVVGEP